MCNLLSELENFTKCPLKMKWGWLTELRIEQREIIFATDFYLYISNQMIKLKVHCSTPIACNISFLNFKFYDFFYFKHSGRLKFDHSIMVFVCVDFNLDYCLFICILVARSQEWMWTFFMIKGVFSSHPSIVTRGAFTRDNVKYICWGKLQNIAGSRIWLK
jgi:hypothetical protein